MAPPRKSPSRKISPVEAVARAAQALRRGAPVLIKGRDGIVISAAAVETASDHALVKLRKSGKQPALLALTHARARTLKMRLYTPDVVALVAPPGAAALRAIADPTVDLNTPLKGPFETLRGTLPDALAAAVKLAKVAGLLPAVVAVRGGGKGTSLAAKDIADYEEQSRRSLAIVTRAHVPLKGAEQAELVAFRAKDAGPEHYAIVIGHPPTAKPVLTRLHSECFTGDLLDSLRCDCGTQLRGAIDAIEKAGGGILLYMAQEGRGIGLINKLRAYRLQDQGFDTMEANTRLGFEEDERLYGVAARMLALLGYKSVKLLTNNPHKVSALTDAGIRVAARVPHKFPSNVHNHDYLKSKARAGHLL
ncbi:MAG TPA: GTP cyclohydrolase II [Rhizomicrobium sp.]|nr:GTP cyclohydrolase II [Rhizomicrobium sp.]